MQTPFISIDDEEVAQPTPPKVKALQDIQVQPAPPRIPTPTQQKKSLQLPKIQQAPPQLPATQQAPHPISTSQQNQYNNLFTQRLKMKDKWEK